jgi:hypothetical protein
VVAECLTFSASLLTGRFGGVVKMLSVVFAGALEHCRWSVTLEPRETVLVEQRRLRDGLSQIKELLEAVSPISVATRP